MENGLDSDGYIINPCSGIQQSYKPLVEEVCLLLKSQLHDRLHSIYLYGSVSRGTAIEGKSDLDIVVLFQTKPSKKETKHLKSLENKINTSSVTLVGFDIGNIEEVKRNGQELFWQFFLKHCCYCLYGNDLSQTFSKIKPTRELTRSLNSGLITKLNTLFVEITPQNYKENAKSIAKQLIRSAYFLIMEKDNSFYNDIYECSKAFLRYYPEKDDCIQLLISFVEGNNDSIPLLHELVNNFGGWINDYKQ